MRPKLMERSEHKFVGRIYCEADKVSRSNPNEIASLRSQ